MPRFRSLDWLVFGAGLLVLAAGLGAYAHLSQQETTPEVTVEPPTFDFGNVGQGDRLTHTFKLTNSSNSAIQVVKVHSSCGCTTTANIEGRSVCAGGSLEVPVILTTPHIEGMASGTLSLFYRKFGGQPSGVLSYQDVSVSANVIPDFSIEPSVIDFGRVDHHRPLTQTIRLRPRRVPELKITHLGCTHPAISARQVEPPPGKADLLIEVTFSGRQLSQSGSVSQPLQIDTTSQSVPSAHVLVKASFQAPLEVQPTAIVIGQDVAGTVEREVRLTAARPVRIATMRCPDSHIALASVASPNGCEHRIKVSFNDQDHRQMLTSEVSLDVQPLQVTDAFQATTVTVPVHRLPNQ